MKLDLKYEAHLDIETLSELKREYLKLKALLEKTHNELDMIENFAYDNGYMEFLMRK
jgi:hypothetical protein